MIMALLGLDRDMDQLFMLTQKAAIGVARFRLVRDDGNDRGEFAAADLPDVEIGHDRIVIAFDRATNFVRQIGSVWRDIEQDRTGIAQEHVGQ